MTLNILFAISDLKLLPPVEGDEVEYNYEYVRLSNRHAFKEEYFFTAQFIQQVGLLDIKGIFGKGSDFGYAICPMPDGLPIENRQDILSYMQDEMNKRMRFLEGMLSFFWLVKDTSIGLIQAIAYVQEQPNLMITLAPNKVFTKATGDCIHTSISNHDIFLANEFWNKYSSLFPQKTLEQLEQLPLINEGPTIKRILRLADDNQAFSKRNRIERAIQFLGTARSVAFLPYKIALYMPIFESLFSTEAMEVTQKVCERVAFYLRSEGDSRREVYEVIKMGYDVRSRFFHGQPLSNKLLKQNFEELSDNIDSILREALNKIIMEDAEQFIGLDNEKFLSGIIFQ